MQEGSFGLCGWDIQAGFWGQRQLKTSNAFRQASCLRPLVLASKLNIEKVTPQGSAITKAFQGLWDLRTGSARTVRGVGARGQEEGRKHARPGHLSGNGEALSPMPQTSNGMSSTSSWCSPLKDPDADRTKLQSISRGFRSQLKNKTINLKHVHVHHVFLC